MANHTGRGYFGPGNPGGPGRPRRETERQYLDAVIAAVPLAKWRKIVKRAVVDAEAGDAKAREWLGKLLLGESPALVAMIDVMRKEIDELKEAKRRAKGGGVT